MEHPVKQNIEIGMPSSSARQDIAEDKENVLFNCTDRLIYFKYVLFINNNQQQDKQRNARNANKKPLPSD